MFPILGDMESNLTLMSPDDFGQACLHVNLGDKAFEAGEYSEAYSQYDTALRQGLEKFIAVLWHKRSKTLEKKRKYIAALYEAGLISKHLPGRPFGYLQQNRLLIQLQRYNAALAILKTASKHVSKTDIHYQDIVRQKQHIYALIHEHNMRHIGRLSTEMFEIIFGQLKLGDQIQCSTTCKSWRKRFQESPMMWINIYMNKFSFNIEKTTLGLVKCIFTKGLQQICIYARDMQDIVTGKYYSQYTIAKPMRLLCTGKLSKIQEMEIETDDQRLISRYIPLLQINVRSLKSMKLIVSSPGLSGRYLNVILNTCTALESLTIEGDNYEIQDDLEFSNSLILKHLTWAMHYTTNSCEHLLTITQRSPKLETLTIDYCYENISKELQRLLISQLIECCPSFCRLQTRDNLPGSNRTYSLLQFSIDFGGFFHFEALSPLLHHMKPNLEYLRLELKGEDEQLQLFSIDGFKKLHSIHLQHTGESTDFAEQYNDSVSVASFLEKCPLLETISLSKSDFTGCDINGAFSSLKNLRRLHLDRCLGLDMAEFKKFATSCDSLEQLAFAVYNVYCEKEIRIAVADIMDVASAFPNLRVLDVSSDFRHGGCEEFAKNLKSKQLEYLILDFWIAIHALEYLLTIPSLGSVYLGYHCRMTDSRILQALENSRTNATVYHQGRNGGWRKHYRDDNGTINNEDASDVKLDSLHFYERY